MDRPRCEYETLVVRKKLQGPQVGLFLNGKKRENILERIFFPKIKRKTEVQAIFFNPFTVCSLCKRKFVVCPFIDEETNGSNSVANELNGLNGLVHLCIPVHQIVTFSPVQCPFGLSSLS